MPNDIAVIAESVRPMISLPPDSSGAVGIEGVCSVLGLRLCPRVGGPPAFEPLVGADVIGRVLYDCTVPQAQQREQKALCVAAFVLHLSRAEWPRALDVSSLAWLLFGVFPLDGYVELIDLSALRS